WGMRREEASAADSGRQDRPLVRRSVPGDTSGLLPRRRPPLDGASTLNPSAPGQMRRASATWKREEMPMTNRTRIQTLVAASMLALVAVSLSVGRADAKPNGPVKSGTCALPGSVVDDTENDLVFYAEGETTWISVNGKVVKVRCGADG